MRQREQALEDPADRPRAALQPARDPGRHGLVEPRHADHDRAAAVGQRAADLGPGDAARQHHRRAGRQRRQEPDRERIGVVERQRQEHAVAGARELLAPQRLDIGAEVRVAERDALGRAGGARRVDQHRDRGGVDLRQVRGVVAQQIAPAAMRRRHSGFGSVVEQDQVELAPVLARRGAQGVDERRRGEDPPSAAVRDDPLQLGRGDLLAERQRDRAGAHDREERQDPFGLVRGEQPDDRARRDARRAQPGGQRARPLAELAARPDRRAAAAMADQRRRRAIVREAVDQVAQAPQHHRRQSFARAIAARTIADRATRCSNTSAPITPERECPARSRPVRVGTRPPPRRRAGAPLRPRRPLAR